MRASIVTAVALLVAFPIFGCSNSTAPNAERGENVAATKPDWQLATLHVDGFKKSKSGGT